VSGRVLEAFEKTKDEWPGKKSLGAEKSWIVCPRAFLPWTSIEENGSVLKERLTYFEGVRTNEKNGP
jgi:hypothetical protein